MKKRKITFEREYKNMIYNQRELGHIKYGLVGHADKNACGAVAVYNIKKLLGIKADFIEEYEKISKHGTTLGLGVFGTNPVYIGRLLKKLNMGFENGAFLKKNNITYIFNNSRYVILLYRWKSIFDVHYAVFKIKDNKIFGYNTVKKNFADVEDMIEKERIKKVYRAWWI